MVCDVARVDAARLQESSPPSDTPASAVPARRRRWRFWAGVLLGSQIGAGAALGIPLGIDLARQMGFLP